jgi:hypothetical protein
MAERLVRQDSLNGIRLNSNQVTHILDVEKQDERTLLTAALCSPTREPRPSAAVRQNFQTTHDSNNSNHHHQQHELPSWVSPTRQRNPLSRSTVNNRGGSLLSAPQYNLCGNTTTTNNNSSSSSSSSSSRSPEGNPETVSPTRHSPVRGSPTRHRYAQPNGTPWRRHHNNNNQEEQENENGIDSRVETDRRGGMQGHMHDGARQTRQRDIPGNARRFGNSENEMISTRRPMNFIRSLG